MKLKQCALILSAAAVLTAQPAQKAKATNATNFVLDNTAGISSDNLGAYIHGTDNVRVAINSAGDFGATFYSGSPRSLNVSYQSPVDPSNAPFSGVHAVNAESTASWDVVTIHDLLSIPIGATALRNGYILVQKTYIDANGIPHVAGQTWNIADGDTDGLLFSVTRTTKDQWIVQSQNVANGDQNPLRFYHDTGTSWIFESAADYHMPIRMTINR
jgi:hypothetical protein